MTKDELAAALESESHEIVFGDVHIPTWRLTTQVGYAIAGTIRALLPVQVAIVAALPVDSQSLYLTLANGCSVFVDKVSPDLGGATLRVQISIPGALQPMVAAVVGAFETDSGRTRFLPRELSLQGLPVVNEIKAGADTPMSALVLMCQEVIAASGRKA